MFGQAIVRRCWFHIHRLHIRNNNNHIYLIIEPAIFDLSQCARNNEASSTLYILLDVYMMCVVVVVLSALVFIFTKRVVHYACSIFMCDWLETRANPVSHITYMLTHLRRSYRALPKN